ncbi:zinc finger BED domain-containing protein 1-like [Tachysurus ichikawai]
MMNLQTNDVTTSSSSSDVLEPTRNGEISCQTSIPLQQHGWGQCGGQGRGGFQRAHMLRNPCMTGCRKIVGHFKHSPTNTEELHQQQTAIGQQREQLIQDVSTRYVAELLGGETYVSCSVVLPAFCHLNHVMRVSLMKIQHMWQVSRLPSIKDLAERQAVMNNEWLKLSSALDPRFKDLKCLARGESEQVWSSLEKILQEAEPSTHTQQPSEEHEPAKKRRILLLGSESDSESEEENLCLNNWLKEK